MQPKQKEQKKKKNKKSLIVDYKRSQKQQDESTDRIILVLIYALFTMLRFSLSFALTAQSGLQAFKKTSRFSGIIVSPGHHERGGNVQPLLRFFSLHDFSHNFHSSVAL